MTSEKGFAGNKIKCWVFTRLTLIYGFSISRVPIVSKNIIQQYNIKFAGHKTMKMSGKSKQNQCIHLRLDLLRKCVKQLITHAKDKVKRNNEVTPQNTSLL